MKKMRKLSVLLLALVMVFSFLPMGVEATNVDTGVGLHQVIIIQNDMPVDSSLISPLGQIMCCQNMQLVPRYGWALRNGEWVWIVVGSRCIWCGSYWN